MTITNLDNFYFRKGSNDAYAADGNFAQLTNYVGKSSTSNNTIYPLCDFFREYNTNNTEKIREHKDVSSYIKGFDPNFTTTPLWSGKTYRGGVDCKPARKYDMEILHNLYITSSTYTAYTSAVTPSSGAGVILITGGGGGGGGGDSGGWLDEPAGGGGGGSGGWAVIYYRYKNSSPTNKFSVSFGNASNATSGNYTGNGGGRESWGSSGAYAYVVYKNNQIVKCTPGGGGASDNTSDTTAGGSAGSASYTAYSAGGGSGTTLVDDNDVYIKLLKSGSGASGQSSGQKGASGSAPSVGAQAVAVPSTVDNTTITWGGKGGGSGGKADSSDPGGGGGAGSIWARGGNGNTGDTGAGDGGYGAGGGGASERGSYSGKGGYAAAIIYKTN